LEINDQVVRDIKNYCNILPPHSVPKGKGIFPPHCAKGQGNISTALCAKGQGLPLGRKLSQFSLFFVWAGTLWAGTLWAGTLWALVTSPYFGAGKTEVFSGNIFIGNILLPQSREV
jgi:hypothetical protein